jgi:hypothetical protein
MSKHGGENRGTPGGNTTAQAAGKGLDFTPASVLGRL